MSGHSTSSSGLHRTFNARAPDGFSSNAQHPSASHSLSASAPQSGRRRTGGSNRALRSTSGASSGITFGRATQSLDARATVGGVLAPAGRSASFAGGAIGGGIAEDMARGEAELELEALKCILLREGYLERLTKMYRKWRKRAIRARLKKPGRVSTGGGRKRGGSGSGVGRKHAIELGLTDAFVDLIDLFRQSTVEAVEAIDRWRAAQQSQAPFVWNGVNYLLKLPSDLDFLEDGDVVDAATENGDSRPEDRPPSLGFASWLGFPLRRNPFVVPQPLNPTVCAPQGQQQNNGTFGGTFGGTGGLDALVDAPTMSAWGEQGGDSPTQFTARRGGGSGGGEDGPSTSTGLGSTQSLRRRQMGMQGGASIAATSAGASTFHAIGGDNDAQRKTSRHVESLAATERAVRVNADEAEARRTGGARSASSSPKRSDALGNNSPYARRTKLPVDLQSPTKTIGGGSSGGGGGANSSVFAHAEAVQSTAMRAREDVQPSRARLQPSHLGDMDLLRVRACEHIVLTEEEIHGQYIRDARGRIIPALKPQYNLPSSLGASASASARAQLAAEDTQGAAAEADTFGSGPAGEEQGGISLGQSGGGSGNDNSGNSPSFSTNKAPRGRRRADREGGELAPLAPRSKPGVRQSPKPRSLRARIDDSIKKGREENDRLQAELDELLTMPLDGWDSPADRDAELAWRRDELERRVLEVTKKEKKRSLLKKQQSKAQVTRRELRIRRQALDAKRLAEDEQLRHAKDGERHALAAEFKAAGEAAERQTLQHDAHVEMFAGEGVYSATVESESATEVGRLIRGHLGRCGARHRRRVLTRMALKCQGISRGHWGRKRAYNRRHRQRGSLLIASRFRGYIARMRVGKMRMVKRQTRAATKVQSRFRGLQGRTRMERRKQLTIAAKGARDAANHERLPTLLEDLAVKETHFVPPPLLLCICRCVVILGRAFAGKVSSSEATLIAAHAVEDNVRAKMLRDVGDATEAAHAGKREGDDAAHFVSIDAAEEAAASHAAHSNWTQVRFSLTRPGFLRRMKNMVTEAHAGQLWIAPASLSATEIYFLDPGFTEYCAAALGEDGCGELAELLLSFARYVIQSARVCPLFITPAKLRRGAAERRRLYVQARKKLRSDNARVRALESGASPEAAAAVAAAAAAMADDSEDDAPAMEAAAGEGEVVNMSGPMVWRRADPSLSLPPPPMMHKQVLVAVSHDVPTWYKHELIRLMNDSLPGMFVYIGELRVAPAQQVLSKGHSVLCDVTIGSVANSRRVFSDRVRTMKSTLEPVPTCVAIVGHATNRAGSAAEPTLGVAQSDAEQMMAADPIEWDLKASLERATQALHVLLRDEFSPLLRQQLAALGQRYGSAAPQFLPKADDSTATGAEQLALKSGRPGMTGHSEMLSSLVEHPRAPPPTPFVLLLEALMVLLSPQHQFAGPQATASYVTWSAACRLLQDSDSMINRLEGLNLGIGAVEEIDPNDLPDAPIPITIEEIEEQTARRSLWRARQMGGVPLENLAALKLYVNHPEWPTMHSIAPLLRVYENSSEAGKEEDAEIDIQHIDQLMVVAVQTILTVVNNMIHAASLLAAGGGAPQQSYLTKMGVFEQVVTVRDAPPRIHNSGIPVGMQLNELRTKALAVFGGDTRASVSTLNDTLGGKGSATKGRGGARTRSDDIEASRAAGALAIRPILTSLLAAVLEELTVYKQASRINGEYMIVTCYRACQQVFIAAYSPESGALRFTKLFDDDVPSLLLPGSVEGDTEPPRSEAEIFSRLIGLLCLEDDPQFAEELRRRELAAEKRRLTGQSVSRDPNELTADMIPKVLVLRRKKRRLCRAARQLGGMLVSVTVYEEGPRQLVIEAYEPKNSAQYTVRVPPELLQALQVDCEQEAAAESKNAEEVDRVMQDKYSPSIDPHFGDDSELPSWPLLVEARSARGAAQAAQQEADVYAGQAPELMVEPLLDRLYFRRGRMRLRRTGGGGRKIVEQALVLPSGDGVSGSRAILSVFVISQREMSTYEQLMRKRAQQAAQARARKESLSAKGGGKKKKRRVAALAQADNDVADGAIMLGALSVGGMLRVRLYVPAESTTHRIFLGARESLELLGNLQAPTRLWMPRLMQRLRLRQPLARAIASGRDGGRARTIMTRFMHKRIVKVPRFDFDLDDASNERRGATRRLAIEVLSEVPLTPPPFRSLAAAHADADGEGTGNDSEATKDETAAAAAALPLSTSPEVQRENLVRKAAREAVGGIRIRAYDPKNGSSVMMWVSDTAARTALREIAEMDRLADQAGEEAHAQVLHRGSGDLKDAKRASKAAAAQVRRQRISARGGVQADSPSKKKKKKKSGGVMALLKKAVGGGSNNGTLVSEGGEIDPLEVLLEQQHLTNLEDVEAPWPHAFRDWKWPKVLNATTDSKMAMRIGGGHVGEKAAALGSTGWREKACAALLRCVRIGGHGGLRLQLGIYPREPLSFSRYELDLDRRERGLVFNLGDEVEVEEQHVVEVVETKERPLTALQKWFGGAPRRGFRLLNIGQYLDRRYLIHSVFIFDATLPVFVRDRKQSVVATPRSSVSARGTPDDVESKSSSDAVAAIAGEMKEALAEAAATKVSSPLGAHTVSAASSLRVGSMAALRNALLADVQGLRFSLYAPQHGFTMVLEIKGEHELRQAAGNGGVVFVDAILEATARVVAAARASGWRRTKKKKRGGGGEKRKVSPLEEQEINLAVHAYVAYSRFVMEQRLALTSSVALDAEGIASLGRHFHDGPVAIECASARLFTVDRITPIGNRFGVPYAGEVVVVPDASGVRKAMLNTIVGTRSAGSKVEGERRIAASAVRLHIPSVDGEFSAASSVSGGDEEDGEAHVRGAFEESFDEDEEAEGGGIVVKTNAARTGKVPGPLVMVTALISYAPPRLRLMTYLPGESQKLSLCLDRDQLRFWMRELAIDFEDGATDAIAAKAVEELESMKGDEDVDESAAAAVAVAAAPHAAGDAALYTALHEQKRAARFATQLMGCLELIPEPMAEGEVEEWKWAETPTTRAENVARGNEGQIDRPKVLQLRTHAARAGAKEERKVQQAKAKAEAIADASPLLLREAVTLIDGLELIVTLRGEAAIGKPQSQLLIVAYDPLTGAVGRATVYVPTAIVAAGKVALRNICHRLRAIEAFEKTRGVIGGAMSLWIGPEKPLTLLHRSARRTGSKYHFVTVSELIGGVTVRGTTAVMAETDVAKATLALEDAKQPAWRVAVWAGGSTDGGAATLARMGSGELTTSVPATLVVTGDALVALLAAVSPEASSFARAVAAITAQRVRLLVMPAAPPTVRRHAVYAQRRAEARRRKMMKDHTVKKKKKKNLQGIAYMRKVETSVVIRHSKLLLRAAGLVSKRFVMIRVAEDLAPPHLLVEAAKAGSKSASSLWSRNVIITVTDPQGGRQASVSVGEKTAPALFLALFDSQGRFAVDGVSVIAAEVISRLELETLPTEEGSYDKHGEFTLQYVRVTISEDATAVE